MLLAFVLLACIGTSELDHSDCQAIESYPTMAECEAKAAYLEDFWRVNFDRELPIPVHCEDRGT